MDKKYRQIKSELISGLFRNAKRTLALMWGDQKKLVVGIFLVIILTAFVPFLRSGTQAFLVNALIGSATTHSFTSSLVVAITLFALALAIPGILYTVQSYLFRIFRFASEERLDLFLAKKRGEIDVATREDPKSNNLLNIVRENEYRLYNFNEMQFYVTQELIQVLAAASILVAFEWWVCLVLVVSTIPELIVEAKYGKRVWGINSARSEVKRRYWELWSHFDTLASVTELKLFQNVGKFLGLIRELFMDFQKIQRSHEQGRFWARVSTNLISNAGIVAAGVWFIGEVVHGNLQVGTFLFAVGAITELRGSLSALFQNLARQYEDSLFVSDVYRFLDLPPAIPKPVPGFNLVRGRTPEIVFDHVSFAYRDNPKKSLTDVSFTIAPGEKVAFVGPNGAGKTTIMKLLCRFYDPTEGRILVDGHDLREVDIESWYRTLGILFQEYAHYHLPVYEGVAFGDSSVPLEMERVRSAVRAGEANGFIESWPDGYRQMLGREFTNGVEPSIGQWQKLAISRVFYRSPRVFVLDEPTSSIDAEAEANIFDKLEKLPSDRTVILVSHRFSTVRHANRIIVLDGGSLVESGAHRYLLGKKGMYARLFNLQAEGYK